MSFWDTVMAGELSSRGTIDKILKSDQLSLVKLLDDDELVQEVSSHNLGLIQFLTRRDIAKELLQWMLGHEFDPKAVEEQLDTGPPLEKRPGPDTEEIVEFTGFEPDLREKIQYKFPFNAHQVLKCEVNDLRELLLKEFLPDFFEFLKSDKLQVSTYSYYWLETFKVISQHSGSQVFKLLQKDSKYIEILINNLNRQTISDLLLYISCEEPGFDGISSSELYMFRNWLFSTFGFTKKIISRLAVRHSQETREAIQSFITDAVEKCSAQSHFVMELNTKDVANELVKVSLQRDDTGRCNLPALNAVSKLIHFDPRKEDGEEAVTPTELFEKTEPVAAVGRYLPQINKALSISGDNKILLPSKNPFKPFSINRLRLVQLCWGFIENMQPTQYSGLRKSGVVPTCINLFFDFPLNNLLHGAVEKIILSILHQHASDLACLDILFVDSKLLKRMLKAWESNKTDEFQAGYIAYIIDIANIIDALRRSPDTSKLIKEAIEKFYVEDDRGFEKFVAVDLRKVNRRIDVKLGETKKFETSIDDEVEEVLNNAEIPEDRGAAGGGSLDEFDGFDLDVFMDNVAVPDDA